MATLISSATGNFTSAGTWKTVDSTSELDSESNNTALTTSLVASAAFTPGAITIDGIAVKVFSRAASPTGTMTVELYNSTLAAQVAGTSVTINVSDITRTNGAATGWYVFSFSSVLLLAANNYQVRATTSNSAQVNLYRNATAANWSRMLRTTTTAAPSSSDKLVIAGQHTAAATNTTYTVTNDNTATTTFGILQCCNRGVFTYGSSASTNYYFKTAGVLTIYSGGKFYMGSSTLATPIPSTSTAKLEFACGSNVQYGMDVRTGSNFEAQGASKTTKALLAADASASATSLTTNVSTGWSNGDVIAIAGTTTTASEGESKALTAGASGTTLTITAITNAHSGTSPTQAELLNLTRNVQIFGASISLQTYINIADAAIVDWDYLEVFWAGSNTANKRGIDLAPVNLSFAPVGCSFHDFGVAGSYGLLPSGSGYGNIAVSNCVYYNLDNTFLFTSTTGTSISVDDTYIVKVVSTPIFQIADNVVNITNCRIANCSSSGMELTFPGPVTGTYSNNVIHSNTLYGLLLSQTTNATLSGFTIWRNLNNNGVRLSQTTAVVLDSFTVFSNDSGIVFNSNSEISIRNSSIYGGTSPVQAGGFDSAGGGKALIENTVFGSPSTHSTADINISSVASTDVIMRNCLLASTEITNLANIQSMSVVASSKHDQVANSHKTWKRYGIVSIDTTIFNTGAPSTRLTPNSATYKLEGSNKRFAVASGSTATVSVWVRKSVVGDGAAYNGNQPRLVLKSQYAVGVTSDTVLATAAASAGTWELLSATTAAPTDNGVFEVLVDCDGTAGWINIDDWTVV